MPRVRRQNSFLGLRLAERYERRKLGRWSGKKLGKLINKSVKSAPELAKDVRSVAIKIKIHSPRDSHSIKNSILCDRKLNDYGPRVWLKIYREIPLVGEINIHQADERWAGNKWTRMEPSYTRVIEIDRRSDGTLRRFGYFEKYFQERYFQVHSKVKLKI